MIAIGDNLGNGWQPRTGEKNYNLNGLQRLQCGSQSEHTRAEMDERLLTTLAIGSKGAEATVRGFGEV